MMDERVDTTEAYALTRNRHEVNSILEGNGDLDRLCEWYDYQANNKNRHKVLHHVRLLDGTEVDGSYYPNATAWARMHGTGPVRLSDDQVGWVAISRTQWSFPK